MSTFDAISVSEEILNKKITFLTVVESLEDKLISKNVNDREGAVKQLTEILLLLPPDFLSDLEVSTLLRFFSARLADSVLLTSSCLKSLYFLSQCSNFPNGGEQTVLTSLFKEHMVQALVQQDRFLVFSLIKLYLTTCLEGLKSIDTEFILGFIQAADGEKDPRNLLLIFECFAKIASDFSLGPFAEDMFELVACYFPVDFKPAADDPYSISSKQLATSLDRCLTCNGHFAKYCFEMLHEKFDESKPEETIYILTLLSKALIAFPPMTTAEFSNALWQEIRKIIITSKNQGENERWALECLKNLIISLTKCGSEDGRNSSLVSVLGQISKDTKQFLTCFDTFQTHFDSIFVSDCEHFLSNVEMQLLDVGNKMALTVAQTDPNVCNRMASTILPLLMEKYQTQTTNKKDYAIFLSEWIAILANMKKSDPILNLKQSLAAIICDEILPSADPILISLGIQMATKLIEIESDFFLENFLNAIFIRCVRFVDEKSTEKDVWHESVSFIKILCKKKPIFVKNYLHSEQNRGPNEMLNVFAISIVDETTSEWFLPILLQFSELETKNEQSLRLFIDENRTNFEVLNVSWRPICRKLFDCATFCIDNWAKNEFNENFELLTRIGNLCQDLFVCLNSESESEMFDIFVEPLRKASTCETFLIVVCEKLFAGLSESNIEKASPFVESARSFVINFVSLSSTDATFADLWARSLAIVVNKLPQSSPGFKILTENYVDVLESKISSNETAMKFFCYTTKALLLRNFAPLCSKCFSKLVDLLNSDMSELAEKCLEEIFVEDSRFLSAKTKVKCTFLYKQRIFTEFVSLLTKSFSRADKSEWKKKYFRILTVLLSNTPKEIQMSSEIEKLIPLLVNSIQSDDLEILTPSVSSVETLLNTDGAVSKLQPHIHSLTQRLCKLAQMERKIDLQTTSLRCLSKIASVVPPSILGPWRQQVLKSLSICLGDPKRIVRREAVQCRNKWFLLT